MEWLHVAVGVVKNANGEILIARRNADLHQGGLWEFPGGKVEAGETVSQALARELKEELAIDVQQTSPLISVKHRYPDRAVHLNVHWVEQFAGTPAGCEGQPLRWVPAEDLINYDFPKANLPVITAVRLPPYYAILDDSEPSALFVNLEHLLRQGLKLIQARLKRLPPQRLTKFLEQTYPLCRAYGATLLLNSATNAPIGLADGMHLTAFDLMQTGTRPEGYQWLAASCHNLAELKQAEEIGADFAVLAPVLPTPTHPDAQALGWRRFAELVDQVNIPVYALGGMDKTHVDKVRAAGGQGIAAIRAFSQ